MAQLRAQGTARRFSVLKNRKRVMGGQRPWGRRSRLTYMMSVNLTYMVDLYDTSQFRTRNSLQKWPELRGGTDRRKQVFIKREVVHEALNRRPATTTHQQLWSGYGTHDTVQKTKLVPIVWGKSLKPCDEFTIRVKGVIKRKSVHDALDQP